MGYAIGAFSSALKAEWHLSQAELESIVVAGPLSAGMFGGALGMIVDAAVPAHSMAGGGALAATAYAVFWAIASRQLPIGALSPVVAFGACVAVSAMGVTLVMTTIVALLVRTLNRERGVLVGIMKAYVGVAAGGLAVMFQGGTGRGLGGSDVRSFDFILAIAVEVAAVTLLPACLLPRRPMRELRAAPETVTSEHASTLARRTAIVCACLAGMLVAMASGALVPGVQRPAALGFLACWLAPLLLTRARVVACAHGLLGSGGCRPTHPRAKSAGSESVALLVGLGGRRGSCEDRSPGTDSAAPNSPAAAGRIAPKEGGGPARGEAPAVAQPMPGHPSPSSSPPLSAAAAFAPPALPGAILQGATMSEMVATAECWLIVYIVGVLFGGGMMVSTNLAQLLTARSQPALTGPCLVLFSIGSALGRALGGLLSDSLRASFELPSTACLAVDSVVMILAHASLTSEGGTLLLLSGVGMAGAAFGAAWPHVVLVAAECFGKAHLGANYGFYDGLCQAVGSLLLAKMLPGYLYARHAAHAAADSAANGTAVGDGTAVGAGRGEAGTEMECVGANCFGDAHRIVIGLCGIALCATAWLMRMQAVRASAPRRVPSREPPLPALR